MDITLRRAAKLRSKLEAQINKIRSELRDTTVTVNPLDTYNTDLLDKARNAWMTKVARLTEMEGVLLAIRTRIASKNTESYISDRIAMIALMKNTLATFRALSPSARLTKEQCEARLAAGKIQLERNGYAQDVYFDFLTDADIDTLHKTQRQLERDMEQLHMEVEEKNAKLTISLEENEVTILTREEVL